MGEHATRLTDGAEIKVGTCEDLYYLRADQAREVSYPNYAGMRFRFPFPDEDHVAPGDFHDHDRGYRLHNMVAPEGVEHYSVQLTNQSIGYVLSIPCPEAHAFNEHGDRMHANVDGLRVGRNGFSGGVSIKQQRPKDGLLMLVLGCSCDAAWRLETLDDCIEVLAALGEQDKYERHRQWLASTHHADVEPFPDDYETTPQKIAARVRQGYDRAYVDSLGIRA